MTTAHTIPDQDLPWGKRARPPRDVPAVVIAWSLDEPWRVGEIALVHGATVLGRGGPQPEDADARAVFQRQRPGASEKQPPLGGSRISRAQLRLVPVDGGLEITNVGRTAMLVRGVETKRFTAAPGDVVTLKNALVLLVTERSPVLEPLRSHPAPAFPFGDPDAFGLVGESAVAWKLRDEIAFASRSPHHVLLQGASGAGKEVAARAIHGLSARAGKALVARNAATFPSGIVDAELFGSAKNYPNTGSPERLGLVGEADGSTLFLDEIGELPPEMQAHLLRVLDRGGEYQRLGESRVRTSDLRLVAATNRGLDALKHDFAARLTVRVEVPGIERRREDIPLLVRHVLVRLSREMPDVAARFFEERGGRLEPRIEPALIEALLLHQYTHHLRELERLVWVAVSTSRDPFLARTAEVEAELRLPKSGEPEEAQIRAALEACEGNVTRAAKALGLKNRFALYRLMRRFGIAGAEGDEEER